MLSTLTRGLTMAWPAFLETGLSLSGMLLAFANLVIREGQTA